MKNVNAKPARVDRVVVALQSARKYRSIAPAALARIASESVRVASSDADAIKRAKRRLHQVFAAFMTERELARATRQVEALADSRGAALPTACRSILALHASTRERLEAKDDLRRFYAAIFAHTGPPARLLDLGCGLHPFARPWMGLPDATRYHARDLDLRLLALVERFFQCLGQNGDAAPIDLADADAVASLPACDVALALKLLPSLERQTPGAARHLLERVPARFVIVSFPTASLGRRERGMAVNYAQFMRELVAQLPFRVAELGAAGELLFAIEKLAAKS